MKLFSKKQKTPSSHLTINAPSTEELKRQANAAYNTDNSKPSKKKSAHSKMENDIEYQKLGKEIQKHLQSGELGLYRNDLFASAEMLKRENKLMAALDSYMYVFYLDLIGISSLKSFRMGLKPHPSVAPGVVKRIDSIRKKLNLSDEELKEKYFECPRESIVPNSLFSYEETFKLLIICLNEDPESVYRFIRGKK